MQNNYILDFDILRLAETKRTLLVGVLFALVTRWNRTFAVASTCIFADTLCGEVRIPPTGGILRRAEIYQKIATDLEIRYNTTPHSKLPYKKAGQMSCFLFCCDSSGECRYIRQREIPVQATNEKSTTIVVLFLYYFTYYILQADRDFP